MDDEKTPDEGVETSGGTEPTPSAVTEPEPQPTDENGDPIAPPADTPGDGSEVEYTGTGEPPPEADPEPEASTDAEVVDGEVVPASVGETQTPEQDSVETTTAPGDEPNVLDSGDELPRHRQEVDGV